MVDQRSSSCRRPAFRDMLGPGPQVGPKRILENSLASTKRNQCKVGGMMLNFKEDHVKRCKK